jgi:alkaline phosphatase
MIRSRSRSRPRLLPLPVAALLLWLAAAAPLLAAAENDAAAPSAPGGQTPLPPAAELLPPGYAPADSRAPWPQPEAETPRRVVLLVGDGMGLAQVVAARQIAAGPDGALHLERLPVLGLVRTHSADDLVTDSAAAATALACGVKTANGAVGVDAGERPVTSLFEAAAAAGLRRGVVATSSLTHATPAAFYAHAGSRRRQLAIAVQLLRTRPEVALGGGRAYFLPAGRGGLRTDGRDLLAEARAAGYALVRTAGALEATRAERVLGLFQEKALTTRPPEPSLAALTRAALRLLARDGAGFLLLVEGSQIDWACHDNDAAGLVRQTLLFDQAVAAAVAFARRDGRTLVIVTADHECGGLIIDEREDDGDVDLDWASGDHTAVDVPLWAWGPGAERFAGALDNTEVAVRLAALLELADLGAPRPLPAAAE